jgi:hypothetical protein
MALTWVCSAFWFSVMLGCHSRDLLIGKQCRSIDLDGG